MRHFAASILILVSCTAGAQTPAAAPRSIADIVNLLEQHRSDPVRRQDLVARRDASPPQDADPERLARFHMARAVAAGDLGEAKAAVDDLRKALALVKGTGSQLEFQVAMVLSGSLTSFGSYAESIALLEQMRRTDRGARSPPSVFSVEYQVIERLARLGDREGIRAAFRRIERAYTELRSSSSQFQKRYPQHWRGRYEEALAQVLAMENKYADAERAHLKAIEDLKADAAEGAPVRARSSMLPEHQTPEMHVNISVSAQERAESSYLDFLLLLDRAAEAEIIAREIVARRIARFGRYSVPTANALRNLGKVFYELGRYPEAGQLGSMAEEIFVKLGVAPGSVMLANTRRGQARAHAAQRRWAEAVRGFETMRAGLANDPETLKNWRSEDISWVLALVGVGRAAEAVPMAEIIVARQLDERGKDNLQTGIARGSLALALYKSGARERAAAEFADAARVIALETASDVERSPARVRQIQHVLEGYIELLIESGDSARAFALADFARGQSVQRALAASAARAAVNDPQLSQIARKEQDLEQELRSLYSYLSNMLGAPPAQRLPTVEADMRKRIEAIKQERKTLLADMTRRFPRYAELLSPRAPSVDDARKALRPGEALVSVLITQERTFVWALPQQGELSATAVPLGAAEADRIVGRLRSALEPEEALLAKFPPFDVAAAHGLYERLLKPVEAGWKGAHTLLVAANGALGRLPFAVLPTAAATLPTGGLLFSGYRDVPWLGKRYAMAQLPSVSSLVTLRSSPPLRSGRAPFAGFGDPLFDRRKLPAPAQAGDSRLRNLKLVTRADSGWADYAELTPLPDTREEMLAIAKTLGAEAKDVFLGVDASRRRVKSMDLSDRRVVAFATHGLIPGDLPGLDGPALALAAPEDPKENPLLTLEDVLGLKLNADWVVLSACNTASGDGEGAEAVSGLGRGFFYAGTRALLVTHWPVESRSARILVTKLFERYAADPAVTRAAALKEAMLAVMQETGDGPDGKPYFSYAHPLYWAPYTLVGDASR